MGIFSRKKLGSDEYENLSKRFTELTLEMNILKSKMEVVTTNMNSIRGLVNRKFGDYDKEDETSREEHTDGLDELRKFNKGR